MTDTRALARHLNLLADDLEDRYAYTYAGVIRRAARALFERPNENPAEDVPRCVGCGDPLPPYAGKGRPRRWCPEGDCVKARKSPRNRKVRT